MSDRPPLTTHVYLIAVLIGQETKKPKTFDDLFSSASAESKPTSTLSVSPEKNPAGLASAVKIASQVMVLLGIDRKLTSLDYRQV